MKSLVNSAGRRCLYLFGQGRGFCAEMMEIGWYSYCCRMLGIEFCLQSVPRPSGVNCFNGWEDYFCSSFQRVKSTSLASKLNKYLYTRRSKMLLPLRRIALQSLHPGFDLFTFDHPEVRSRFEMVRASAAAAAPCRIGVEDHFREIYKLNERVKAVVSLQVRKLCLPDVYCAFHIRRGDKINEAQYSSILRYKCAYLSRFPSSKMPVYLMTDDRGIVGECKAALPGVSFYCNTECIRDMYGYSQEAFNSKPPSERFADVMSIVFDLEVARSSLCFFGTGTSNIFWLMRYLHAVGSEKLIDIDQPSCCQ